MAKIKIDTAKAGFKVTLLQVDKGKHDNITIGIEETRNNVAVIDLGNLRIGIDDVLNLRVTEEGELKDG